MKIVFDKMLQPMLDEEHRQEIEEIREEPEEEREGPFNIRGFFG